MMNANGTTEVDAAVTPQVKVKCAGSWVYAEVVPHTQEVQRRRSLGSIDVPHELETLDILLRVPLDEAVSEAVLSRRERDKLRRLSPGLVHFDTDGNGKPTVHRLAVPPASVQHVMVPGRNWITALTHATKFAPYCRRSILLSSMPADEDMLLLEARFYGVGIALGRNGGDGLDWILEPAPFVPERFTGASWRFAESFLEAWQLVQETAG